jgi:hypothetical protein
MDFGSRTLRMVPLLIAAGNLAMFCEEIEMETACDDVCATLADCEDAWLVDDGEEPMTVEERRQFLSDCRHDCEDNATESDIRCLKKASCEELRDGECR